ncbi:glutamate--cysteine ligase [Embleya sp. NBC_00896]|uniref:carboxylate-amine ligase n=1 Tax=Embleya sp. NBC_00896 TaxID=2975961 RepID=UPI00386852E0|nr:glutamate--cysteine ligase [Embleya sp. NBC_00896]
MGDSARTVMIGVEEEFHIVDLHTRRLVPRVADVLGGLSEKGFTTEFRASIVETNSEPHAELAELREDLLGTRRSLVQTAGRLGLGIAAAGTVPIGCVDEITTTPDPRYLAMARQYRELAEEQLICGAQVHVDVADRELAVAILPYLAPWLPVLLALSASSPYWLGRDTGYASWRTLVWQRWPTTGPPGTYASAAEYDATVAALVRSGVIGDAGMIYYDVRPSRHLPTLELRVCDACPAVDDVLLIAGLFRALVVHSCGMVLGGAGAPATRPELLRAATWRAARSGLEGVLVDPIELRASPAARVVSRLLERLRPILEEMGDWLMVRDAAVTALARGSWAGRQRAAVRRGASLADVVDMVLTETRGDPRTRS